MSVCLTAGVQTSYLSVLLRVPIGILLWELDPYWEASNSRWLLNDRIWQNWHSRQIGNKTQAISASFSVFQEINLPNFFCTRLCMALVQILIWQPICFKCLHIMSHLFWLPFSRIRCFYEISKKTLEFFKISLSNFNHLKTDIFCMWCTAYCMGHKLFNQV